MSLKVLPFFFLSKCKPGEVHPMPLAGTGVTWEGEVRGGEGRKGRGGEREGGRGGEGRGRERGGEGRRRGGEGRGGKGEERGG